jgi:hypothetical protein
VGGYQFYFWCQRNVIRAPRRLLITIDEWIPYRPAWVWIYSFLYYPAIMAVNLVIATPQEFTQTALSYLVLLFFQVGFFLILPVETPLDWRALNRRRGMSERFLAFVQSIDGRANCFPSMHCSVASMTALYLTPHNLLAEEERDLISRRTKKVSLLTRSTGDASALVTLAKTSLSDTCQRSPKEQLDLGGQSCLLS